MQAKLVSVLALVVGGGVVGYAMLGGEDYRLAALAPANTTLFVEVQDLRGSLEAFRQSQAFGDYSDSKTGEKVIPLGAPALELLRDAQAQEGNPHVCFGSRPGAPLVGLQKIWEQIREAAGLGVRLHDLRHSFASTGAGSGESLLVLGRLLGHTQARTTQRYAHLSPDPVRQAADRISGEIAAALNGRPVASITKLTGV